VVNDGAGEPLLPFSGNRKEAAASFDVHSQLGEEHVGFFLFLLKSFDYLFSFETIPTKAFLPFLHSTEIDTASPHSLPFSSSFEPESNEINGSPFFSPHGSDA